MLLGHGCYHHSVSRAKQSRRTWQGSNWEPATSTVMSAREVACSFRRHPGRLTWHISGINHPGRQETGRLLTPHWPPPPPPVVPRQPKHAAQGANTIAFCEQKKSRPPLSLSTAAACHIS